MRITQGAGLAGIVLMLAASTARAEELLVVGSWSNLPLHQTYEKTFWAEALPAASEGKLTVNLTTFDQMGVAGSDVFRLLGDGVFDIGMTVADYTVADAPELEGLDVPLVANTIPDARKMIEAARPMVEDSIEKRFGAKVLAIVPYSSQVVFCKPEIASLTDLKGKKIRGSGRMTTKLLEALGAEGVNVAFSEVPGALERGVIDCAVTGIGSGYRAGWWEVSTHLMTLPLGGWDPVVTAVNLDKWESLPPEQQQLIQARIKADFEEVVWAAAESAFETAVACLTGQDTCSEEKKAEMTLVEATDSDLATARKLLTGTVLPEWAERAGEESAKRWNDSVGKTVGVQIPM